jgi:hypothetical protein
MLHVAAGLAPNAYSSIAPILDNVIVAAKLAVGAAKKRRLAPRWRDDRFSHVFIATRHLAA